MLNNKHYNLWLLSYNNLVVRNNHSHNNINNHNSLFQCDMLIQARQLKWSLMHMAVDMAHMALLD
jgi:hypothetical protein